jgi:hypothetical protein
MSAQCSRRAAAAVSPAIEINPRSGSSAAREPRHEREERRLADAAAADHPDPPAGGDVEVETVEDGPAAEHARDTLRADAGDGGARFDEKVRHQLPSPA